MKKSLTSGGVHWMKAGPISFSKAVDLLKMLQVGQFAANVRVDLNSFMTSASQRGKRGKNRQTKDTDSFQRISFYMSSQPASPVNPIQERVAYIERQVQGLIRPLRNRRRQTKPLTTASTTGQTIVSQSKSRKH